METIKWKYIFLSIINVFFKKWCDKKKIGALEKDVLKTSKINKRKKFFKELPFYHVLID